MVKQTNEQHNKTEKYEVSGHVAPKEDIWF